MIYLYILMLIIVILAIRLAYAQGFRKAYKDYYVDLYLPFYRVHDRTMLQLCKVAADSPEQAIQTNLVLSAQNRRLKKKAIILARKYGKLAKQKKADAANKWLNHLSDIVNYMELINKK